MADEMRKRGGQKGGEEVHDVTADFGKKRGCVWVGLGFGRLARPFL